MKQRGGGGGGGGAVWSVCFTTIQVEGVSPLDNVSSFWRAIGVFAQESSGRKQT